MKRKEELLPIALAWLACPRLACLPLPRSPLPCSPHHTHLVRPCLAPTHLPCPLALALFACALLALASLALASHTLASLASPLPSPFGPGGLWLKGNWKT